MNSQKTRNLPGGLIVLAVAWLACHTHAEVRSYTLGIDVNCPTGLGE